MKIYDNVIYQSLTPKDVRLRLSLLTPFSENLLLSV